MNNSKFLATGLLVSVFAAGVVVGNAGRLLAVRSTEGSTATHRPSYVEWLEEQMTLNTQQETAIAVILDQYNDDMHDLWSYARPRSDELRQSTRAAIADIMSEDQRVSYEQMNQELDSLRAERRKNRYEDE